MSEIKNVFFKTFGCRTNIYDTQVMMRAIKDFNIVNNEEDADIVVINSCTVTNGADSGVRNYIRGCSQRGKKVVLAGCGAISKGESLYKDDLVFGVLGHSNKENLNQLLLAKNRFYEIGNLSSLDNAVVTQYEGKTKAFVKIQEGCDFSCSYCIIPSVRGRSRSQKQEYILSQIEILAQNGYGEFVLTGTNIGSYGKDLGTSLGELLGKIGLIKGVRRIRLGSIEPVQIDDRMLDVLDAPFMEKHLHIALQHTHKEMLKIMRRRNKVDSDLKLFETLSDKGFALGTDFIVGHPGESEKIWSEGFEIFKLFPLTHIHAFIYSQREGTHSATLPNVINGKVSKDRLKQIEDIVKEKNYNFRLKNSENLMILIEEKNKDGLYTGFDQYYNRISIRSQNDISKEWLFVKKADVKINENYVNIGV